MRRIVGVVLLIALAVALLLVLRERKRAFVAEQVRLLQSSDSQEATEARKRLQRVGRSAVRPVCALLEHKHEDVRARAALALANIGHAAACGPLMEAAKRGDFPAADALDFMNHPRANEARAWVWCRLGDKSLDELKLRLPIGGRAPTEPWASWGVRVGGPRRPFEPMRRIETLWPSWGWGWQPFPEFTVVLQAMPGEVVTTPRRQSTAAGCYARSLEAYPLPDAFMGQGRLEELVGDYPGAAESYAGALKLASESATAQRAEARAKRLAALARQMQALLPSDRPVQGISSHASWSEGDATYYVAVTVHSLNYAALRGIPASIALFQQRGAALRNLDAVRACAVAPGAKWRVSAYADLVALHQGKAAALAVIADTAPTAPSPDYRLTLYGVADGALIKTLELQSAGLPCVTDLDDDGDAELITWRWALYYPQYRDASVLWPIVRTRVNGRYEERTEQFPALFGPVAQALRQCEGVYAPKDPKVSEYLGRAYEILGETAEAIAAYERAERKYVATADHDEAAMVRARRQRLEQQRGQLLAPDTR